jgi:hypothetical protein
MGKWKEGSERGVGEFGGLQEACVLTTSTLKRGQWFFGSLAIFFYDATSFITALSWLLGWIEVTSRGWMRFLLRSD